MLLHSTIAVQGAYIIVWQTVCIRWEIVSRISDLFF